jgi:hypothetical protein
MMMVEELDEVQVGHRQIGRFIGTRQVNALERFRLFANVHALLREVHLSLSCAVRIRRFRVRTRQSTTRRIELGCAVQCRHGGREEGKEPGEEERAEQRTEQSMRMLRLRWSRAAA